MSSLCVHLYVIDRNLNSQIIAQKREASCYWCNGTGKNQWLCLFTGCLKVGCDESCSNHSLTHNSQIPSHCISLNLSNLRAWCYMCEIEVTSWLTGNLNVPLGHHLGELISAPGIHVARPLTPTESSAEDTEEDQGQNEAIKPRGLVGLRNLGLTCYMNAALQALSNSVPLSCFLRDCPAFLYTDRRQPAVVKSFYRLVVEIWHEKRPSFVAPSNLIQGFRNLYPAFRAYTQQDSQEFLRYFMDQVHEELKQPCISATEYYANEDEDEGDEMSSIENSDDHSSDSADLSGLENDEVYETCDSDLSDKSTSSDFSNVSLSPLKRPKRKRKQHLDPSFNKKKWINSIILNNEPDHSEFSDALSDSSLLEESEKPRPSQRVPSSVTSGLGSSKPSLASNSLNRGRSSLSAPITYSRKRTTSTKMTVRRKKSVRYRSIISDIFDGILVSSVQCLTCNTVSSCKETFQDLSLPIPSSDQLNLLQNSPQQQFHHHHSHYQPHHQNQNSNFLVTKNTCDVTGEGWMWWLWSWLRSWFWGPTVSLFHCLAAFFSADELKGDNMYSCEKCGKLRNGVKYSKVIQLPEILIIHLKRFRNEYMFSSKISQHVSFPLHGLDITPFLHKDCSSNVGIYDLYAVICHHGVVGAGHYTTFAQNSSNNSWYEFDDQCVTLVTPETVANCEAYVLFYKKVSPDMVSKRERTVELMQVSSREPSLMQFYISKQWLNKFNTFAEPGPIDNSDFLCPHGGVQPSKTGYIADLVMLLSQGVWEYLHQSFGGGPACTRLYECVTCREELDLLLKRQTSEYETFIDLNSKFQEKDVYSGTIYAISMRWFCTWEGFVRGRLQEPPGPIDNSSISITKHGQVNLKYGSDYAPISEEIWMFFFNIYGGGPELCVRRVISPPSEQLNETEEVSFTPHGGKRSLGTFKSYSSSDLHFPCGSSEEVNLHFRQRSFSFPEIFFTEEKVPDTFHCMRSNSVS